MESAMKTGKIVLLTTGAVLGAVLLVCVAMWSHMKKQAAAHDHHPAQHSSVVKS